MFNKDVKVPLQEAELVGTSSSNMEFVGAGSGAILVWSLVVGSAMGLELECPVGG